MQVQSAGRQAYQLSVGQALGKMWREEGWRGFMRGNGTNCIRIVPYSAVQFSSYNFYKRVSRGRHCLCQAFWQMTCALHG
jgi:solute carrier family 25 phosphate transporter 23/24/25/41